MAKKNQCVTPGDLVAVYPKREYAGYIIRTALYSEREIVQVPSGTSLSNDSPYAIYHHIVIAGGILVLPDEFYTVEKLST